MGRKSKVSRLEPAARTFLEKLLREDRLTLDELLKTMREKFPGEVISRSGLHRYKASVGELTDRMRGIDAASRALVDELGEGIGDKAGGLLSQAITTLAANAALNAQERDDVTVKEIGELARAARAVMQTRTMSLKERQTIEEIGRQKLLAEQEANLQQAVKAQGMSEEQADFMRRKILGMA